MSKNDPNMTKSNDLWQEGIIYRPDIFNGKFEGFTWIAYTEYTIAGTKQ